MSELYLGWQQILKHILYFWHLCFVEAENNSVWKHSVEVIFSKLFLRNRQLWSCFGLLRVTVRFTKNKEKNEPWNEMLQQNRSPQKY